MFKFNFNHGKQLKKYLLIATVIITALIFGIYGEAKRHHNDANYKERDARHQSRQWPRLSLTSSSNIGLPQDEHQDESMPQSDNRTDNPTPSADNQTNADPGGQTAVYSNPFVGEKLYVNTASNAQRQADIWRSSRPDDARLMEKIASQPETEWFGDWNSDIFGDVSRLMNQAAGQNAMPVLVAYNIPYRDCGLYSAGGAGGPQAYRQWIQDFARAIGDRKAVVILEPDALAGADCLSAANRQMRFDLIRFAVETLKARGAHVYIDAGNAFWIDAGPMAVRLQASGIGGADGFALNVSNYIATADNINYGMRLSGLLGGKHFVVDTSRNGLGPTADMQWCNPSGRALGSPPTTHTGHPLVDAFLWIKKPGESDGTCNGGPPAGAWWPEYALGLAQRANF